MKPHPVNSAFLSRRRLKIGSAGSRSPARNRITQSAMIGVIAPLSGPQDLASERSGIARMASGYFTRAQVCPRQIGPTQPDTLSLSPPSTIFER